MLLTIFCFMLFYIIQGILYKSGLARAGKVKKTGACPKSASRPWKPG